MEFKTPANLDGAFLQEKIDHDNLLKSKEEAKLKKQNRHDWGIALFNTFGGAIAGALTGLASSIIFWLLTNSQ